MDSLFDDKPLKVLIIGGEVEELEIIVEHISKPQGVKRTIIFYGITTDPESKTVSGYLDPEMRIGGIVVD